MTRPEVRVQRVGPLALLPDRNHEDDAGLDLYVSETVTVLPHRFVDIHCGIAVEMPIGCWGLLHGRSSTLRKRGLLVNPGIIDPGYRGELFTGVWNLTNQPVQVQAGDRVGQLILLPNMTEGVAVRWVRELSDHARGSNGFGSSGR